MVDKHSNWRPTILGFRFMNRIFAAEHGLKMLNENFGIACHVSIDMW
jgi:hypothetical protein